MSHTQAAVLVIAQPEAKTEHSPEKKTFNSLIRQIEQRRKKLAGWETAVSAFHQKFTTELAPLVSASDELRAQMVRQLAMMHGLPGLSRHERKAVSDLAAHIAGSLLESGFKADDIKDIYNRHSGSDRDAEVAMELEMMKSMATEMFGVEFDEDDSAETENLSHQEAFERIQAKVFQKQAEKAEQAQNRRERRAQKKNPKQNAEAAKQEAEAAELLVSLREIYRKLASALHPDREPDAEKRAQKTILMTQANNAYAKSDLLKLLELQIQLEHIDKNAVNGWDEEKVARYNKILKNQVRDLDRELSRAENSFRANYNIAPHARVSPSNLINLVVSDIEEHKRAQMALKRDLSEVSNPTRCRGWLRSFLNRA